MSRNQKPNSSTATVNSTMSGSAATVDSGRSSVKGQKVHKGNFSYASSEADTSANNATSEMITKLDALFRIKHRYALSAGFEKLVPLSVYAKSPELRASLEKVMPELLAKHTAHEPTGPLSMQESSSQHDHEREGAEESSELVDGMHADIDIKTSLDAHKQKARDERAAKSVIRLSNAILPLLEFYHNSVDLTASAPKASTTPTGKHKAKSVRKTAAASLGVVTNEIIVQEVHHAFDAVLEQIQRLEMSTATGSTEVLHGHPHMHGTAKTVASLPSLSPPPPPLVDVTMQENNEKVYAHIASLEKQLHNLHDSKKRQYESMLEQLRTSERKNSTLKKKLEVSQQQKDEFIQVAVDKEKQLQSALVHLSVAQEEIKHLKIQNAKIPQQKREHQKEANKAAQQNSKYSAAQFIKLTAQIDSLREELQRERQRNHEESERLKAAAEEATSKAAFADIVITQLQSRIANSDYFVLHPAERPLEYPPHPAAAHPVLSAEDGAGSPADLDDSNLYVDAQLDPSAVPHTGQSAPAGPLHGHSDGLSTISSGSSKHSTLESGDAHESTAHKSAPSQQAHRVPTTDAHKHHEGSRSARQSGTPTGSHRPASKVSAPAPQTPSVRDGEKEKDRSVRESVVTSPTRASYHRTLATVEQFAPAGSTASTSHANSSMNAGQNTTAHTLPSGSGQGSNHQVKLPWRPSTPNASPAHIRPGYYQHAKSPKGYPAHSHHILQEDGFMFNNHTRSENRSPVRSIRPKKFSASSSGSLFNETTNSRQRSASVSPFRRSTSPSALYAAHHRDAHHNKHVPQQVPYAKVYRELNMGKCTYCTHNLLELWTRKFGPPIGAPEEGSDHESDTSSSEVDEKAHHKRRKEKSPHSTPNKSDRLSTPKRGKKSKHSKSKAKKSKHGREDESASESSSSESSEESSGEDGGTRRSTVQEESPKRTAEVGGPFTAVLDSAGHPISYALGRSDADDHVAGIHLSGKINPQLLPPRIEVARSASSHSQHASVHWQQEQGGHSADANIAKHHHKTPPSGHRDAGRHSRDFVDEMSAITETSEQGHSQSQPHRHSSDAHKHQASGSASASGIDIRSKAGTPLSSAGKTMGIADAGMSPPPPPPAERHHSSHSRDHSTHESGHEEHHRVGHSASVEHAHSSTLHSHTSTHASHHSAHHSVHHSADHAGHHAAAHHAALFASRDSHSAEHPTQTTVEPAPDSSNETLTSFPVGPANSATSQHTAQLLQKLRARNIHPKTYLTTADTRNTTTSALTTQCNQLVREFNEILMTLGNEILVSENVKLDYKQEIHESANLVSELQRKVSTLQSENNSLYETVSASQAEKESLSKRHEELVYSIQEELLQARVENEDLVEETESLKHQLRDTMNQSYSAAGTAAQLEGADHFVSRSRSQSNDHRDARSRSTSPHHGGHTSPPLRSRSQSSAYEENALHRHDQQRITMLEEEVSQYKTMHHELSQEQQRYKEQLFAVEAELAEARQQLTERDGAGHSIHHQFHKHGHSEHHDHHRSSHASVLEDQLAEARQKAADTEAINQVQSQLLQQKDFQVQQLKDNIFTQQQQFAALQQQHVDMHSRLAGHSPVQHVTRTTSTDSHHQGAGHAIGHSVPPVHTMHGMHGMHSGASSPHSHAHSQAHVHVGIAAPSSDSHSQLAALKQQLDATHRELEEVKRANQQGTALHLQYPSAGSSSSSIAGSVGGSLAESVRGHGSHHGAHHAHHHNSMPASPMSMNSAMSGGTSVSSMMNSSAHGHNAYQGDLQYISHLDVILEEGSVRTSSGTAPSAATPRGANMHGVHTPMHGAAHINQHDDRSRASQHSHAVQGQQQGQHAAESASVKSEYSNQQGTPLHTMLNQHYNQHQAQDDAMSEDMNRQITSMTATNAALTSRVTQLEQRLRHSELRCKLLTDQIKSMPVSLSVAQAEKRVVESKLEKATETYSANIKKLQEATAKKIHELTAYLQIERAERAKCEQQLQEQKETIHQLTHHMKILRTQQQVSSQEYSLPEMHDIFSGHTSDILGDSHGHLFPEYSHPATSAHAHTTDVHNMSSGHANVHNNVHSMSNAHTNAHSATHTNTAAESFHLSRTVPLTPMSLSKPDTRTHTQHHPGAEHRGADHLHHTATHSGTHTGTGGISYRDTASNAPYAMHTPIHGPSQGNSGSVSVSESVLGSVMGNANYNTAHSIRSSIPPAPWEEGSLFAH